MDKHLLTEIEIRDFKCFKDFKAEGFKRVNLIGGKNNVGKTAFMEACFLGLQLILMTLDTKKLEEEDISFIELGRDKTNEVKAMTFPYKWFIDEIEQNHEVRGW